MKFFTIHQIATIISRIFEPAVTIPIAFILGAVHVGLSPIESIGWLVFIFGPALAYRFWLKKVRGLDWDIKNRDQRVEPFLKLLGFLAITSLVVWAVEPRLLWILGISLVWVIGFTIITAFWTKISGHSGGDALATGLIVYWYGWQWWPVLLVVPIVAWSRVVRRDHTVIQVTAGALYSWILIYLFSLFS